MKAHVAPAFALLLAIASPALAQTIRIARRVPGRCAERRADRASR